MNTIQELLAQKGSDVATIDVDATVLQAAQLMSERHIGALVVTRHDRLAGILTERDVMNRVVAQERLPGKTLVKEVMTTPVACCRLSTRKAECRAVMKKKRIRHLPVVQNDRLAGIVSIIDIIEGENAEKDETIQYLYGYVQGEYR
jgi:CBS domain-containing protein